MGRKPKKEEFKHGQIVYKNLPCEKNCGNTERVEEHVVKVLCWSCTAKAVPPPKIIKATDTQTKTRKARGWKFMKEFVDSEGNVYFKGVEQPDLKGTKEPTIIKKKSKFEREQERAEKEAKLAKKYERKQEKLRKEQQ